MSVIDTHCHLDFPDFREDVAGVLARARAAGVAGCVTICTHVSRFGGVAAIAERYTDPQVWCSIGTHPHHAAEEEEARVTAEELARLATHPRVVGIGECGLDYYYDHSPRDVQRERFRLQVQVARELDLPLIIHTRDADDDTLALLKEGGEGVRGVLHCFSGSRRLAEAGLELGFYISFSGILTFKKSEDLRAIARDIPLNRLLVETDAPFLAPVPQRGKTNEPSFVMHTAAVLAGLRGLTPDEVGDITTHNFFNLFTRARRT